MVWIAISPKGMTPAFIMPSGQGVNEHIYKKECLGNILPRFVKKHYRRGKYYFGFLDLASHYSRMVQEIGEEIGFGNKKYHLLKKRT